MTEYVCSIGGQRNGEKHDSRFVTKQIRLIALHLHDNFPTHSQLLIAISIDSVLIIS